MQTLPLKGRVIAEGLLFPEGPIALPDGSVLVAEIQGARLVKVHADVKTRDAVMRIVDIFRAHIIDVSRDTLTVEITGEGDKTEALLGLLEDYGIVELVRTGVVALERGPGNIHQVNQTL